MNHLGEHFATGCISERATDLDPIATDAETHGVKSRTPTYLTGSGGGALGFIACLSGTEAEHLKETGFENDCGRTRVKQNLYFAKGLFFTK